MGIAKNKDDNARKYYKTVQRVNGLLLTLVVILPLLWSLFDWPLATLLILVPAGVGGILALIAWKFSVEKKYKEITATFREYVVHNISVFIFFGAFLTVFFLLSTAQRLPSLWIPVIFNLILVALLLLTWVNPLKRQWVRNAGGAIRPELQQEITAIADKFGIAPPRVYVIDWRRLKVANALQMGVNKYYVFISNYLLDNLSAGEVTAVIAHELAHAKMKHVAKLNLLSWPIMFVALNFIGFSIVFNNQDQTGFAFALIVAGFATFCGGLGGILPAMQRRCETAADLAAIRLIDGNLLISALEKITDLNLIPRRLPRGQNLSHPSTERRVERIRLAMKESTLGQ